MLVPEGEAMTEREWLTTDDFPAMMIYLRGELTPEEKGQSTGLRSSAGLLVKGPVQRTTPARLRAFAVACLPRWRELPLNEMSRDILDAYEAFLSRRSTPNAFWEKSRALFNVPPAERPPWFHAMCVWWDDTPYGIGQMTWNLSTSYTGYVAREEIARVNETATEDERFAWGFFGYHDLPSWKESHAAINGSFAPLLRETVGNPFRPVAFSPQWRTDTAISLARTMYESRDFGAMPILADALQDAGCDSDDVLSHCREANATHVRGCWVCDLVLDKQ
jgi:hypothetical protein